VAPTMAVARSIKLFRNQGTDVAQVRDAMVAQLTWVHILVLRIAPSYSELNGRLPHIAKKR